MKDSEKRKLIDSLLPLGKEAAPENFTSSVMNRIDKEEALSEKNLQLLVSKHALLHAPGGLAENVLDRIAAPAYRPVLSSRVRIIIAAALVLIMLIFLTGATNLKSGETSIVSISERIFRYVPKLLSFSIRISPVMVMSIACIFLLLFFDSLLKRKKV